MVGAAGAGTLVAEEATTLRTGVVPALLLSGAEECPVLWRWGRPLSDVWRLPLPW